MFFKVFLMENIYRNGLELILGQKYKNKNIYFGKKYKMYFGYKRVRDGFWARIDAGFGFSMKKRVY